MGLYVAAKNGFWCSPDGVLDPLCSLGYTEIETELSGSSLNSNFAKCFGIFQSRQVSDIVFRQRPRDILFLPFQQVPTWLT
jgi:hypothetical protein